MINKNDFLKACLENRPEHFPESYKRFQRLNNNFASPVERLGEWSRSARLRLSRSAWRALKKELMEGRLKILPEIVKVKGSEEEMAAFMDFLMSEGFSFHHIRRQLLDVQKFMRWSENKEDYMNIRPVLERFSKDLKRRKSGARESMETLKNFMIFKEISLKMQGE